MGFKVTANWITTSPAYWFKKYTIHDSRFMIQEVFIVNLYRSMHKMFDMLFSTNTTKGGWNHIWLIYPLFHYCNLPNVLWALRTVVSKNNIQTKQIHRFSTLIVYYKFVSKTFYEWTWFVDREMICLQMFSLWFSDKYNFNRRLKEWTVGESRISRGSAFHNTGPAARIENLRTSKL